MDVQYENGLGPDQICTNPRPGVMFLRVNLYLYAFDTNVANRTNQDVGLDGLSNADEGSVYTTLCFLD
jgi:hypothetical protein